MYTRSRETRKITRGSELDGKTYVAKVDSLDTFSRQLIKFTSKYAFEWPHTTTVNRKPKWWIKGSVAVVIFIPVFKT